MPIETRIDGNPESLRAVSNWLRGDFKNQLDAAVDTVDAAKRSADSGWDGTAGDNFAVRMQSAGNRASDFATAANDSARSIDDMAAALQTAQTSMQNIRADALAADLTVNETVIEHPGPAPPEPGTPPHGDAATPAAVSAHNAVVRAAAAYAQKLEAYETAETNAGSTRTIYEEALNTLSSSAKDTSNKIWFTISDLVNGVAGGFVDEINKSAMGGNSKFLAGEANKFLDLARNAPAGTPAAQVYRDWDEGLKFLRQADEFAEAAKTADRVVNPTALKVGGALAAGGIAYDIYNGKPVDQAVVSGGVGFGASVAAGAVLGTAIPVPVVGTAVGALGGAAVGIFTSGAVDSMFEDGFSVGNAASSGADAVADTGKAIGGVVTGAWDAIF